MMISNNNQSTTVLQAFMDRCKETPDKAFMTQPMGGNEEVKTWTFSQTLNEALRMANYLESLDFEKGSKIAICSKNCAWWLIADIAIWLCGHVSVPVYPTLTSETVSYILEHSESKLLFVGKLDEKPWSEMKSGVPKDLAKISFPVEHPGGDNDWRNYSNLTEWEDIISRSQPNTKNLVTRKMEEMATIVYTSGSTGRPKGVMISFEAMTLSANAFVKAFDLNSKDRYLSYLPLSHAMERWLGQCVPMVCGMQLWYAESLNTFVGDLNRCRPTIFLSVPRLWTKFNQAVLAKMPSEKYLNLLMSIPVLGDYLKRKILKGLGLDSVRLAGSGSAPIPKELLGWYKNLGLNILEGYGMTENFAYSHVSLPGRARYGYVGEPYAGVEQRLTEEGEIEVKSPGLMMGYYKNEQATRETITEDGWLKTGDRGEIDSMGRLKITGRTKEIFKTSKGKYVAPAPIENKLNVNSHIELSCVSGSGQPQPFAMVQLSEQSKKAAAEDLKVREQISAQLETFMRDIVNKSVDSHEALQCLVVLNDDWTPENGFLTPTQKLQRRTIEEKNKEEVDAWYGQKMPVVWAGW